MARLVMIIREATAIDANEANAIYDEARKYMRKNGNLYQWTEIYPGTSDILGDIPKKESFVVEDGGEIVGVFHFHIGNDLTYGKIYDGEWKNSEPYAVIHRVAVKYYGKGIADFIYSECFKRFPNLKIDTHEDNIPMQKSLEKNGFEYCGIIHLESGAERLAFEKVN
jgi:RimJ/RimL family protein N-acetyltransferase